MKSMIFIKYVYIFSILLLGPGEAAPQGPEAVDEESFQENGETLAEGNSASEYESDDVNPADQSGAGQPASANSYLANPQLQLQEPGLAAAASISASEDLKFLDNGQQIASASSSSDVGQQVQFQRETAPAVSSSDIIQSQDQPVQQEASAAATINNQNQGENQELQFAPAVSNSNNDQELQRSAQAASMSDPNQLQSITDDTDKSSQSEDAINAQNQTPVDPKNLIEAQAFASGLNSNQIEQTDNTAEASSSAASDKDQGSIQLLAPAALVSSDDQSQNPIAPDSTVDIGDSVALKRSAPFQSSMKIEEAKRSLGEDVDPCNEPLELGTCEKSISRFYYAKLKKECLPFSYTGCGQNANNFGTIEECINICKTNRTTRNPKPMKGRKTLKLDLGSSAAGLGTNKLRRKFPLVFCDLQRDNGIICPGIHRGNYIDQFYFDSVTNRCNHFLYNGCGGNANRFSSLWECTQSCARKNVFRKLYQQK